MKPLTRPEFGKLAGASGATIARPLAEDFQDIEAILDKLEF